MEHLIHAHLPLNVPSPIKAMMAIYWRTLDDIQEEKDCANGWKSDSNSSDDNGNDGDGGGNDGSDGSGEVKGLGSSARDIHHMLLHGESAVLKPMSRTPSPTPAPRHNHNRHEVANPRTPTCFQLCSALQNAPATRALVNMMPSHTPAPVPRCVYLHPTVDVNWTSLPQPARDIFDELDLVCSELVKAKSRND